VQIIVNADDFGANRENFEATVDCFASGGLTSATIIPQMPASPDALRFAREHPEFSFGVYLTLTGDGEERPLADPAAVPSLVDSAGRLRPTRDVRLDALMGRLSTNEIEVEVAAQLEAVRSHGVRISHVDSHRHLHKLAPFHEALRRALPRYGIRRVRNIQDVYLARPYARFTYWAGPRWRRRLVAAFATTDHFYMPASTRDVAWHECLVERCRSLDGATLEVGVHPGYDGWREDERITAIAFAQRARDEGHTLATWDAIDVVPQSAADELVDEAAAAHGLKAVDP
jgi:predicted glycoside hydrolase/deacetylase ChbG (UPF0249 family)